MDENVKKYNDNLRTKMRNMRFKNPREFWKIWNKVKQERNRDNKTQWQIIRLVIKSKSCFG